MSAVQLRQLGFALLLVVLLGALPPAEAARRGPAARQAPSPPAELFQREEPGPLRIPHSCLRERVRGLPRELPSARSRKHECDHAQCGEPVGVGRAPGSPGARCGMPPRACRRTVTRATRAPVL